MVTCGGKKKKKSGSCHISTSYHFSASLCTEWLTTLLRKHFPTRIWAQFLTNFGFFWKICQISCHQSPSVDPIPLDMCRWLASSPMMNILKWREVELGHSTCILSIYLDMLQDLQVMESYRYWREVLQKKGCNLCYLQFTKRILCWISEW